MCNKVYGNAFPFPLGNVKRLQRVTRPLMFNLRLLTYQARSNIICHICLHTSHQKVAFKSLYILLIPVCMLRRLLCPSSKSIYLNIGLLGTQTLSLKCKMPSLPILKSFLFSVPNSPMICFG